MHFQSEIVPKFPVTTLLLLGLAVSPGPPKAQDQGATTPQIGKPTAANATSAAVEDPPSTSKAMHLYRDGKYDEARSEYNRVIQNGFNAPTAYAGLARLELKTVDGEIAAAQRKTSDAVTKAHLDDLRHEIDDALNPKK